LRETAPGAAWGSVPAQVDPMFEFGRDIRRRLGGRDGIDPDPRLLELAPPPVLMEQARAVRPSSARDWRRFTERARLWAEHARRTGLSTSLGAADLASEQALAGAGG